MKFTPRLFTYLFFVFITLYIAGCATEDSVTPGGANPPSLSTSGVTNITATSATGGGNVSDSGGSDVTQRGIVWGTAASPTTSLATKTSDGSGTGSFTSSINGLTASTTYFVRAYATNSKGTSYGNEINFTTPSTSTNSSAPSVETVVATNISFTTATIEGNVTSEGISTVTARGFVYASTTNPTLEANLKTSNGTGTGSFTASLSNLSTNTTYFARAYATNSAGTNYGAEINFKTTAGVLPTVATLTTSAIGQETVTISGNVTAEGSTAVTQRGVIYSTFPDPLSGTYQSWVSGAGAGTFSANIFNLLPATTYYAKAYAKNSVGTAYGDEISFTTISSTALGQYYQGGIVGYLYQSGDAGYDANTPHGIVVSVTNLSTLGDQLFTWSKNGVAIDVDLGASGTQIGSGANNTNIIVTSQGTPQYAYAAGIAKGYSFSGFYNDWFLPSSGELNKLYANRTVINAGSIAKGGTAFTNDYYWSSTDLLFYVFVGPDPDYLTAYAVQLGSGAGGYKPVTETHYVRAVKYF